ncbi:MAG: MarR family winged helix-turn-helix transcriptional regulator, partial [Caulobacteraceae bacterium]
MNLDLRELYHAIGDLTEALHRPQPGTVLLRDAGVSLDRALLPLLVRVERRGPIGIVELAELSGRDYTTISRQVARLEGLGLASRRTGAVDGRVREVVITPAGLAMTGALDQAREKALAAILASWSPGEIRELARLSRRLAAAIAGVEPSDQLGTQEPGDSSGEAAAPPAQRRRRSI